MPGFEIIAAIFRATRQLIPSMDKDMVNKPRGPAQAPGPTPQSAIACFHGADTEPAIFDSSLGSRSPITVTE